MNSISDKFSPGLLQDRANLPNSQLSSYARRQSVNSAESLDTALTIKTREGDIVTLSSNSFSELNAFEYDSQGQMSTDNGNVLVNRHIREISLTTGEQFSFSVQGDLNEQELADIEAIVKGVDAIAAQMVEGDMDEAFEKAMSMGSYSSVSMYSADISYERSYSMIEETRSTSRGSLPAFESEAGMLNHPEPKAYFIDQMAQFLDKQEEKMLAKAQHPLSALFEHLLENASEADQEETPAYKAIQTVGEQLDQIISEMLKKAFETTLNGVV
ncbi:MAG: hypothetical protein GY710_22750 [Desulfobacteraceae bacterium]|nr:hypothetical protein [Desulfobacteraceae bacterium]